MCHFIRYCSLSTSLCPKLINQFPILRCSGLLGHPVYLPYALRVSDFPGWVPSRACDCQRIDGKWMDFNQQQPLINQKLKDKHLEYLGRTIPEISRIYDPLRDLTAHSRSDQLSSDLYRVFRAKESGPCPVSKRTDDNQPCVSSCDNCSWVQNSLVCEIFVKRKIITINQYKSPASFLKT
jgi:hypothetical protein